MIKGRQRGDRICLHWPGVVISHFSSSMNFFFQNQGGDFFYFWLQDDCANIEIYLWEDLENKYQVSLSWSVGFVWIIFAASSVFYYISYISNFCKTFALYNCREEERKRQMYEKIMHFGNWFFFFDDFFPKNYVTHTYFHDI